MKVAGFIILAVVLQTTLFAQKPADPEASNKRAISVAPARTGKSVQTHGSRYDASSVPKSGSASARDLAKLERTSVQQMKTSHKANSNLNTAPAASPAIKPQSSNKPIKFSYHPPQAAGKTSVKSPPAPAVRSHSEPH